MWPPWLTHRWKASRETTTVTWRKKEAFALRSIDVMSLTASSSCAYGSFNTPLLFLFPFLFLQLLVHSSATSLRFLITPRLPLLRVGDHTQKHGGDIWNRKWFFRVTPQKNHLLFKPGFFKDMVL